MKKLKPFQNLAIILISTLPTGDAGGFRAAGGEVTLEEVGLGADQQKT